MIDLLYNVPFPSYRTGALFNTFSYPTKISPEAVAIFIACHTKVGDTVFDPFGGSGTTGIAAKLCDSPTVLMRKVASELGLKPVWGPRKAVIYELSPMGTMIGNVMCNTDLQLFLRYSRQILDEVEKEERQVYEVVDPDGNTGYLRYAIWSDVVACPHCKSELKYADIAVQQNPIRFVSEATCPHCNNRFEVAKAPKLTEEQHDHVLGQRVEVKKRVPYKIYGTTGKTNWSRLASSEDQAHYHQLVSGLDTQSVPVCRLNWGVLYRKGYHKGIDYLHQMYTERNAYVFSRLWERVKECPEEIQSAMKVFLLSYNASHSTLMTRVVAKKNNADFILTGAQPGVLYISSLPVEKNIFTGLRRKLETFVEAFKMLATSQSTVQFVNQSSTMNSLPKASVDYVFTDPPFGDYIPYSEINQLNELWLGRVTDSAEEVIVNEAQQKKIEDYQLLMTSVFKGIHRALKDNGCCTLVFHSAKSAIWRAILASLQDSSLSVTKTSILDKVQASFKQVNSTITVKGDPLLLLYKSETQSASSVDTVNEQAIILRVKESHRNEESSKEKSERMYSEYVSECMKNHVFVTHDAKFFYQP